MLTDDDFFFFFSMDMERMSISLGSPPDTRNFVLVELGFEHPIVDLVLNLAGV